MYLTLGWLSAADQTLDYQAETGTDSVDLLTLFSTPVTPLVTKVRACVRACVCVV